MKKFLLSIALLAAGATMMNAASFNVKVNGTAVENGATITHTTIEENMPEYGILNMAPKIELTNTSSSMASYTISATGVSIDTQDFTADDFGTNPCGRLQFCVGISCQFIDALGETRESNLSIGAGETNSHDLHITYTPAIQVNDEYAIVKSYNGKSEYQFTISNGSETMTFNIVFDYDSTEGAVNDINIDNNATAEYYNLQGIRVANPEKGIYIVRRGNKISKEFVR